MNRRDIAAGVLVGSAFAAFAWWCSRDFDPQLPPEGPADEFDPPLKDAVASQLFAQASAEACLSGESVVAAAERICRCEAPTGEFNAVRELHERIGEQVWDSEAEKFIRGTDPLQGRERFKGPEDIA